MPLQWKELETFLLSFLAFIGSLVQAILAGMTFRDFVIEPVSMIGAPHPVLVL
jgi:hypothetical protein